jgi:hypothetical protein
MNEKHPFDDREWRLQERALREERIAAADSGDAEVEAYRKVVRALREPLPEALPPDFAAQVAARAARLPARGDGAPERWLMRALVAAFVASALYVVASQGGQWLQASLDLLPAADAMSLRNWGLALAACVAATWAFGRWRDPFERPAR